MRSRARAGIGIIKLTVENLCARSAAPAKYLRQQVATVFQSPRSRRKPAAPDSCWNAVNNRAADPMPRADLLEHGLYLYTIRDADVTPWFKEAARRHCVQRWHGAIYGPKGPIPVGGQGRSCGQQSPCVGMGW